MNYFDSYTLMYDEAKSNYLLFKNQSYNVLSKLIRDCSVDLVGVLTVPSGVSRVTLKSWIHLMTEDHAKRCSDTSKEVDAAIKQIVDKSKL